MLGHIILSFFYYHCLRLTICSAIHDDASFAPVKPVMPQQELAPKLGESKNFGTRVFTGEMKLIDASYKPEYEDPKSAEFRETADALQEVVSFYDIVFSCV